MGCLLFKVLISYKQIRAQTRIRIFGNRSGIGGVQKGSVYFCGKVGLLTNEIRSKKHLGPYLCLICGKTTETIMHFLRDCDQSRYIWFSLLNIKSKAAFFIMDLEEWFSSNLHGIFSNAM